jgi:DNA-binding LacI/PurR family transcriptional regulator/GAF domain-containing protein
MLKANQQSTERTFTTRSNSRPTIAFLTHSLSDSYGMHLWEGVIEAARSENFNLICFPGWALNDKRGFNGQANIVYQLMSNKTVDGLVISSGTLSNYIGIEQLQKFCEHYQPLPMASIAVELQSVPSVIIENRKSMFDIVSHLIEDHHLTRIVFVSGNEKSEEAKERYLGFQDALKKHMLTPAFVTAYADWEDVSGVNAMKLVLDEKKLIPGKDFQAVVTGSDNVAIGVLTELQSRGIRVPADIALTGFDGQESTKYLTPRLTTVQQPLHEQAFLATKCVIDQIRGMTVEKRKVLTTELQIRQSCGCAYVEARLAKADNTVRLRNIPQAAPSFSLWRNAVPKMIQAKANFPTMEDKEQIEHVFNAFSTEIKGEGSGGFLAILHDILRQAALVEEDVLVWQDVISVMRREISPLILDDHGLYRAEDLWQQARVIIGERAQRIEGYRRLVVERRQATLDRITRELLSTSSTSELMDILAKEMSNLEIPECYVSLYENPVVPTNRCQLILAYGDGHVNAEITETYFQSWQLIPPDLLPRNRLYTLIVEPLYFRENQIGLAVFQAGPCQGTVYETLRGQLSSALWSSRLVQYLHALYEASNSITSLLEPNDILEYMIERACKAVGAKWASVVIVDKEGRPERLASKSGSSNPIYTAILIETAGMVAQVMRSNEPILIDDIRRQSGLAMQKLIELRVGAFGCFPLRLADKPIGAMWIYYEKTHHFSIAEINALQLYVNHAAIAYNNAKRMKELAYLREAAEKLASVVEIKEILQQIVKSARKVLEADSAVIWPYDAARNIFIPSELEAEGVEADVLEECRKYQPRPEGTTALVLRNGYLPVNDAELHPHPLRTAIGVKSFQGIALKVEKEPLGVLYVNYKNRWDFDGDDEATLRAFVYYAAFVLKKARLLQRLNKVHDAARIVAEASVLKNLQDILNAIAKATEYALSCDVVTLYTYDEATKKLDSHPRWLEYAKKQKCLSTIM